MFTGQKSINKDRSYTFDYLILDCGIELIRCKHKSEITNLKSEI